MRAHTLNPTALGPLRQLSGPIIFHGISREKHSLFSISSYQTSPALIYSVHMAGAYTRGYKSCLIIAIRFFTKSENNDEETEHAFLFFLTDLIYAPII